MEYNKKDIEKRINIIKGQLEGLSKMIDQDTYCIEILDLSYSIQKSLQSLDNLVLERHLHTHVAEQFKTEKEKAIEELMKIYRKTQRSK